MIDASPAFLWVFVSALYILTGVYLQLFHGSVLSRAVPFTFFTAGAGIFTAVNRTTYFDAGFAVQVAEFTAIGLFVLTWALAVYAIHGYCVERYRRLRADGGEAV